MIIRIFASSVLAKPLNNAQIVRGVFVYTLLNMANLIPFTKRFESSENLVKLLESRGLQICDRNKAIQYLDNIGYYRLSAYMYPLLKMPKTAHLYKEGSTFEKVMMLYRFDKKLRLLMFNEIEKIEIAIRRAVMQITADMTDNPFWLTDSSYFLDSSKFNETMRAISRNIVNQGGVHSPFQTNLLRTLPTIVDFRRTAYYRKRQCHLSQH